MFSVGGYPGLTWWAFSLSLNGAWAILAFPSIKVCFGVCKEIVLNVYSGVEIFARLAALPV